eukprot:799966_1
MKLKQTDDFEDDDDEDEDDASIRVHYDNRDRTRRAKKRRIQAMVIMSLLCVLLIGTIVIGIIIEKKYGKSTVLNANNIKNELVCHYADNIYPIDSDCGVQYCINNNINRSFTLTKGWSNKFMYEYNKTVVDMRQYLGN